jgi:hypothetical protein
MRQIILLLGLAALLVSAGCSVIEGGSSSSQQQSASRSDNRSPAAVDRSIEGIEVTWEVPGEPVDGFVIRYGPSRSDLSKELKVSADDLRQESDPEYGPVYRYFIKDVTPSTPLFVSIAAYKGDRISNFSEVLAEQ